MFEVDLEVANGEVINPPQRLFLLIKGNGFLERLPVGVVGVKTLNSELVAFLQVPQHIVARVELESVAKKATLLLQ